MGKRPGLLPLPPPSALTLTSHILFSIHSQRGPVSTYVSSYPALLQARRPLPLPQQKGKALRMAWKILQDLPLLLHSSFFSYSCFSLRYVLHTINLTFSKCTIRWFEYLHKVVPSSPGSKSRISSCSCSLPHPLSSHICPFADASGMLLLPRGLLTRSVWNALLPVFP